MPPELPDGLGPSPTPLSFIDDASRNLRIVRRHFGPRSAFYRDLARRYGDVARELGCWGALQRVLHPLRRRASPGVGRPWRVKARRGAGPSQ
jgi:hypothetical protein